MANSSANRREDYMAQITRNMEVINRPSKSIQQCFVILGAKREEVYKHKGKTLKDRLSWSEQLYWAGNLHREMLKDCHPDGHRTDKPYWEEKSKEVNHAYRKIRDIIRNRNKLFIQFRRKRCNV
uniref:Uncharacterized protein n=1 Tax=viral metagenome TaxID=1070528 RepID=A0A6M3XLY0_9ZZZZ